MGSRAGVVVHDGVEDDGSLELWPTSGPEHAGHQEASDELVAALAANLYNTATTTNTDLATATTTTPALTLAQLH